MLWSIPALGRIRITTMNANIADDVLAPGFGAGRIEPVTMTQTNRGVQRNAHGFQRGLGRPDQDPFRRHQEAPRRELRRRQHRRQEELRRQQEGGQPQQPQEEEDNEE